MALWRVSIRGSEPLEQHLMMSFKFNLDQLFCKMLTIDSEPQIADFQALVSSFLVSFPKLCEFNDLLLLSPSGRLLETSNIAENITWFLILKNMTIQTKSDAFLSKPRFPVFKPWSAPSKFPFRSWFILMIMMILGHWALRSPSNRLSGHRNFRMNYIKCLLRLNS